MACNNCTPLEIIPTCTEEVVLGIIDADTEVYIYVHNLTTGYLHKQEAVSNGDGELTLLLTEPDTSFYNPNSNYEVWATLRDDNVRLDIITDETTTPDTTDTCLKISFLLVGDTYEIPII